MVETPVIRFIWLTKSCATYISDRHVRDEVEVLEELL